MFGKQSPAKSLLTFALLGSILSNVVIALPTKPTDKSKNDDIVKTEQTFYSVSCVHAGWGPASHCGAHCTSAGRLDVNKSTCPVGSQPYENVYWDCYCVGECTPCKDAPKGEVETDVEVETKAQAED